MNNSQDKAGGPAFPVFEEQYHYGLGEKVVLTKFNGMTLRDYFATHAPACPADWPTTTEPSPLGRLSQWNYAYADAMLAAREAQ